MIKAAFIVCGTLVFAILHMEGESTTYVVHFLFLMSVLKVLIVAFVVVLLTFVQHPNKMALGL